MPTSLSASASTSAAGTAGGGNVFTAAPLFGSQIGTTAGSAYGSGGAGGGLGASSTPAVGSAFSSGLSAFTNPVTLIALVVMTVLAIGAFLFFRKAK